MPKLAKGHLTPSELDELLKQYKEGSQEAFEKIYNDTYYSVYYTIYLLNNNQTQITDLVQDTYYKMLENLDKYQMGTNLRAWLCRIAHNLTINYFIKNRHEYAYSEIEDTKLPLTYPDWEYNYQVDLVLKHLPKEQADIFEAIVMEGLSFKEAAKKLGIKLNRAYYLYRTMQTNVKKIRDRYF